MKKLLFLIATALTLTVASSAQAGSMGMWANSVHDSGSTMHSDGSMGLWAN